jgi:quinol-cytochrome oxidoreductase complex cytochrome b subunit
MSDLDRLKEQLVYLRFWIGIMVATEIALMGWLISTPIGANQTLWFIGAFGAVLLGAGIFLVHRQIERRIDQIGKL